MAAPITEASTAVASVSPVIEYQLNLHLHPAEHRLEGVTSLIFPVPVRAPSLRLAPRSVVRGVQADGRAVPFTFHDGQLALVDDRQEPIARLRIEYSAVFDDPPPRDTLGMEDPSFGVNATILPEGVFLGSNVAWFPQVAGARGRHQVKISTPEGMLAVTAGRYEGCQVVDGAAISVWSNTFPLVGLSLAAGYYEVTQEDLDGIQLLTFLSKANAGLAQDYQSAMRRHLIFYRKLLGPFPFAKFAVVENFLPTGFGLPSWTLLGNSVVRLPFLLDTSLPHEIVHSWWGNAVEVDYSHGNWAEGLTTYLSDYLLKEQSQPAEALAYRRKLLRDYASLVDASNDFPLSEFTGRMSKSQQAIGYGKSAMVFHMLRRQVGDEAFFGSLRQLAATGQGRTVSWPDLEAVFSAVAGVDLSWFFRQWIDQPGAPLLSLADIRTAPSGAAFVASGELRQTGTVYRLPVSFRLTDAAGGETMIMVPVSGERTPFRITASGRPKRLDADPNVDLFRRLDPEEIPPTVNDLAMPQQPLVIIAEGQPVAKDVVGLFLKGLHWDAAEIVQEKDLEHAVMPSRDVIFIGWPRRPDLQPPLPASLSVDVAQGTRWHLANDQKAGDVLFTVLSRQIGKQGLRAIFLTRTSTAARSVVTKISHYGRYSLLVFEDGHNLIKLTWDPEQSPMSFIFPGES